MMLSCSVQHSRVENLQLLKLSLLRRGHRISGSSVLDVASLGILESMLSSEGHTEQA
jgi:hypothetical protein